MDKILENAKKLLLENDLTCVMMNENQTKTSKKRGIAPLLEWFDKSENFASFCVADKVVGKGAAFLYVLMNVKSVYAFVISKSARQVLARNNIELYFEEEVETIRNRDNTGFCPIESALKNIEDAKKALPVISETLEKLK